MWIVVLPSRSMVSSSLPRTALVYLHAVLDAMLGVIGSSQTYAVKASAEAKVTS